MYKKLLKEIKKYDKIVIGRHIGVDPDAMASQIALREIIKEKYPKKEVYAVGLGAARFHFMGKLDKLKDFDYKDSLLIVVDIPDKKRLDLGNFENFTYTIKIDHHPFIEEFCDLEIIDETASSVCQMIMEICFDSGIKIKKEVAELLFIGLVADTNRFMFEYTTPKTFYLVGKLIKETGIDINKLYDLLFERPIEEVRMFGYINESIIVTENGLAYVVIDDALLKKYKVDAACPGNLVNDLNNIKDVKVWVTITEDVKQGTVRAAIRSKNIIINEIAGKYNGGGHKFASGARLNSMNEIEAFIKDLDDVCAE